MGNMMISLGILGRVAFRQSIHVLELQGYSDTIQDCVNPTLLPHLINLINLSVWSNRSNVSTCLSFLLGPTNSICSIPQALNITDITFLIWTTCIILYPLIKMMLLRLMRMLVQESPTLPDRYEFQVWVGHFRVPATSASGWFLWGVIPSCALQIWNLIHKSVSFFFSSHASKISLSGAPRFQGSQLVKKKHKLLTCS